MGVEDIYLFLVKTQNEINLKYKLIGDIIFIVLEWN